MKLRKIKRSISLYLTIALLLNMAIACQPDIREQQKLFKANEKKVNSLIKSYPAFRAPFNELLAEARQKRKQSADIKDLEKRNEFLKKASAILNSELSANLQQIQQHNRNIVKLRRELKKSKTTVFPASQLEREIKEARNSMWKVGAGLKRAKFSNSDEAVEITEQALSEIKQADGNLERLFKSIKSKEQQFKDEKE